MSAPPAPAAGLSLDLQRLSLSLPPAATSPPASFAAASPGAGSQSARQMLQPPPLDLRAVNAVEAEIQEALFDFGRESSAIQVRLFVFVFRFVHAVVFSSFR